MARRDYGRDENGRWQKGHCPNPNGRPRKKPEISDADVNHFKNSPISITINGEQRHMSRHEALMHAMYERAIKGGSVQILRMLFARFEKSEETYADLRTAYKEVSRRVLEEFRETGTIDEKLLADYLELRYFVTGGDPDRPAPRRRQRRAKPRPEGTASWRKGRPKPQSVIDLEREIEAEELAKEREHARRAGETFDFEGDEDDESNVEF